MKKLIAFILGSSSLYCSPPLQCDIGLFATVDFFYWFAQETDLSYALKVKGTNQIASINISPVMLAPKKLEQFKTSWDPGFRIGLGFKPHCDGWDLYCDWTYFHNEKKNKASVVPFGTATLEFFPEVGQYALIDPWINIGNFTSVFDAPFLFDTVTAKWKLNLNTIDLELGRKTLLSCSFAMRPYAGVRSAFLNLEFNNSASLTPNSSESVIFKDLFENHFWGVGVLAGIQPEWHFNSRWFLFSNLDAALLYGKNSAFKKENYFGTAGFGAFRIVDYHNKVKSHFSQMQAIIDLSLGLRWEETWCCERYRSALDLSWEQHFWFDASKRLKLNVAFLNDLGGGSLQFGFQGYDEVSSNLIFGGPVLRARFDF
ncbi:MAG TPA: Lpg1974 family pore-forming outer membrane protein [Rhabdochlamydiaceae bacterium]|nr:Lpg1974 family pore-forming outer membrane protein [Rhabdochlamydiaceae bacterium]